jgi:hypothetical protein
MPEHATGRGKVSAIIKEFALSFRHSVFSSPAILPGSFRNIGIIIAGFVLVAIITLFLLSKCELMNTA